jgi:hypothetical protein
LSALVQLPSLIYGCSANHLWTHAAPIFAVATSAVAFRVILAFLAGWLLARLFWATAPLAHAVLPADSSKARQALKAVVAVLAGCTTVATKGSRIKGTILRTGFSGLLTVAFAIAAVIDSAPEVRGAGTTVNFASVTFFWAAPGNAVAVAIPTFDRAIIRAVAGILTGSHVAMPITAPAPRNVTTQLDTVLQTGVAVLSTHGVANAVTALSIHTRHLSAAILWTRVAVFACDMAKAVTAGLLERRANP